MNADMRGKNVLVTGAGAGIGFATAMELAKRGASLILVCRTKERAEKARDEIVRGSGNRTIEFMVCDLASQKQIRALAAEFKSRFGKLPTRPSYRPAGRSRRTGLRCSSRSTIWPIFC